MRREHFEHLIRAAADASHESEIVVIGSQAILGSFPDAPEGLLRSIEADVYPLHRPERGIEIEGSIGDGSPFQRQFGYYAHAVGPKTAKAPAGWQARVVSVEIPARAGSNQRIVAHCMEVHDLVLAKCAAGRERDQEFAHEAIRANLVSQEVLQTRVDDLPLDEDERARVRRMLGATKP